MKVNVHVVKYAVGLQIVNALNAYKLSIGKKYKSDWQIIISDHYDTTADINICFSYMFNDIKIDVQQYDIVLFCNGGEPLAAMTEEVKNLLDSYQHVYLIANSYLDNSHAYQHKVIFHAMDLDLCKSAWTTKFYPQYYENFISQNIVRQPTIEAINGQNRTVRAYFFDLLNTTTVKQNLNLGKEIVKTLDSFFESKEDFEFIDFLEKHYAKELESDQSTSIDYNYYEQAVDIGLADQQNFINIGYFVMPLYYENSCVIFPETTYQNNEITLTEKSLKCFYAKCLPFVVGGSNINKLYNDLGFKTAWNFLPAEHQKFDDLLDHKQRHHDMVQAVQWLESNKQVFQSKEYTDAVENNYNNFMSATVDLKSIWQLEKIIENHV